MRFRIKKILKEAPEETKPEEKILPVQKISFEENPLEFILIKYPSLKETLIMLMSPAFKDYINGIYVVAPRPTTFKIVLHNNQEFFLTWTGKTYICKVEGKKYYLTFLSDKQRATNAIAQLLELGAPIGKPGPDKEQTSEPQGPDEEGEETPPEGEEEAPPGEEEEPLAEGKKTKKKLLKESTEEYDEIIRRQFGGEIPPVKTKRKLGEDFQLKRPDLDVWEKLFELVPATKGGTATKGSGNGEIAAYWLFQGSGYRVEDNRRVGRPDLLFNGKIGVEIKSKPSKSGWVSLGKFSEDKNTLFLLNTVFGFDILLSALRKEPTKEANPSNFRSKDLVTALFTISDLEKNKELRAAGKTHRLDVINALYEKIAVFKQYLDITKHIDPQKTAALLLVKLLEIKLGTKPGARGYILDCQKSGIGTFYFIDLEKLKKISPEQILKSINVDQAQIKANFDTLFK